MMTQSQKDSRKQALISESQLWEYLIEHNEVEDFKKWLELKTK